MVMKNKKIRQINLSGLELMIANDYKQMSRYGAVLIYNEINKKPNLLISTASGATPTMTYDLLAQQYKRTPKAFAKIRIIKLDEWGGIPMDDPATCETYLQKHLVVPLKVSASRFLSFASNPRSPSHEIKQITKRINRLGAIDLCILGLGVNGHLAFNEPAPYLQAGAHITNLSKTTRKHPMTKLAKHKIKYGLTLGIDDIMHSKKIILLVNGAHKKPIFKKFLSSKITTQLPVTMLWLHPNVTIICDQAAIAESKSINPK